MSETPQPGRGGGREGNEGKLARGPGGPGSTHGGPSPAPGGPSSAPVGNGIAAGQLRPGGRGRARPGFETQERKWETPESPALEEAPPNLGWEAPTLQLQLQKQLHMARMAIVQVLRRQAEAQDQGNRILRQVDRLVRQAAVAEASRVLQARKDARPYVGLGPKSSRPRADPRVRPLGFALGAVSIALLLSTWTLVCARAEPNDDPTSFRANDQALRQALERLIDPVTNRGAPPSLEEGDVLKAFVKTDDAMLRALAARALTWQGYTEYSAMRDSFDHQARQIMYHHWAKQRLATLRREASPNVGELKRLEIFLHAVEVGLPRGLGNVTIKGGEEPAVRRRRGHPSEVRYRIETHPTDGSNAFLGDPASGRQPTRLQATWIGTHVDGVKPLPDPGAVSFTPEDLAPRVPAPSVLSHAHRRGPTALEFDAYDCSYPRDMTAVTLPSAMDCDKRSAPPITHESTQEYALMQEVPTTTFPIRRCQLRRSKLPVYCGNYDHQTIITSDIWQNRPVEVSPEECRAYWRTEKIKVKVEADSGQRRDVSFHIAVNDTTRIRYDSHGRSWVDPDEGQCTGVEWYSEAQDIWVSSVIQTVGDELDMTTENALADVDGRIDLPDRRLGLPDECPYRQGYCVTRLGTFIWDPQPEAAYCSLYLARPYLNGTEIDVAEDGQVTTIFTDNKALVRVIKKRPITMCSHQVHPTNFKSLFLVAHPQQLPKHLRRPVPVHAVSITTYFNQQSNWLRGYFDETVQRYMERLVQQRCRAEQEKRALEWAELAGKQAAISAGETINLGQGVFATATGEAWRHFRCRPVKVVGVNRDRCYNALPVVASAADTASFLRNSRMPNTSALYMEPGTRMLTAIAVELPCSAHLAALYQNTAGGWIQATPALLPAAAPKPIDTVDTYEADDLQVGDPIGPDFEGGGIYPLEVIREIDDVRSRHKKVAWGTNRFADAVQTTLEEGGHNTPDGGKAFWTHALGQAIPELPTLQAMASSLFWKAFGVYEEIATLIVGTYLLYRLLSWFWATAYRCLFPAKEFEEMNPWGRRLAGLMPNAASCLYDLYHPGGRRRQAMARRQAQQAADHNAGDVAMDPLVPPEDQQASPSYVSFEDNGLYPALRRLVTFRGPRRRATVTQDHRDGDPPEGGNVASDGAVALAPAAEDTSPNVQ
jgi:hypothetical protein